MGDAPLFPSDLRTATRHTATTGPLHAPPARGARRDLARTTVFVVCVRTSVLFSSVRKSYLCSSQWYHLRVAMVAPP